MEDLKKKIDELEYAKKAVLSCLESESVLVDWHDIEYWASRVNKLRKEIKEVI